MPSNETGEEIKPAQQDLRNLRAPVHVAKEVGKGVGRGALLLGRLPPLST
jgi:hypothetical protein